MDRSTLSAIKAHHAHFMADIEKEVQRLEHAGMPDLTPELFALYEQTGNRLLYEEKYFERRKFFVAYALYCLWHRRPQDLKRLEEIILEICREKTWALPAHVDRSKPDWERTVDLFAAETAQGLAHVLHLLGEHLAAETVRIVKEAVSHRVLLSYIEAPYGFWRFENMENNWVAVCLGCVGSAALHIGDDPSLTERILERIRFYMPNYLAGMCEDGTCPEGISYFTYGMVFYTGFSEQLLSYTEGREDWMSGEKMKRIARFQQAAYLPGGVTVSFSDASRRDAFRLGLTAFLYQKIPGVKIPDIRLAMDFHTDHCYRFLANYQDDVWVRELIAREEERLGKEEKLQVVEKPQNKEEVAPAAASALSEFTGLSCACAASHVPGTGAASACDAFEFTVFPDAQWAIWKKEKSGIGIAFKGGHNDEPHNHNDVGSFLFAAGGEIFLTDLGSGEYTREYFDPETRYRILCNRSLGHSVPLLKNREQKEGTAFAAESFTYDNEGRAEISFAAAYGMQKEVVLTRKLESLGEESTLQITDKLRFLDGNLTGAAPEIAGSPQGDLLGAASESTGSLQGDRTGTTSAPLFAENLVTQIRPRIEGSKILLDGERGTVYLTPEGVQGDIYVSEDVFRNHHGKDEPLWRIRFAVKIKGDEGVCRIHIEYRRK